MRSMMRGALLVAAVLAPGPWAGRAEAGVILSDNFDSGTSAGLAGADAFWKDASKANGLIVQNSSQSGFGFSAIAQDAGGSGRFLFEGTAGDAPGGQTTIYASTPLALAANTDYIASFKLTNENTINVAQIAVEIAGLTSGPFSATGTYATNGWQTFTFAFNSGSNTSTALLLHDLVATGVGNDFGIDDISVTTTAVPEPSTLVSSGIAALAALGYAWRRRRAAA